MSRRIVIQRPGGYERIRIEPDDPRPPGPGELAVAVDHIGINFADTIIRRGLYASARELVGYPIVPGFEAAGTVTELGPGVEQLDIGDRVIVVSLFGAYRERLVVAAESVFRYPDEITSAQAAAIPVAFLTAWMCLVELGSVAPGKTVLIHSAAGGVGGALVQIARRHDARVCAVVGRPDKIAVAEQLGAERVLLKTAPDLWDQVSAWSPQGVDIICDASGFPTLRPGYDALAPLGRLVVYGFHTMLPGPDQRLNWLRLAWQWLRTPRFNPMDMTMRNRSVMACNLSFLESRKALLQVAMAELLDDFDKGRLQPLPVTSFAFDDVVEAHRAIESGTTIGKLVLATQPTNR